MRAAYKPGCRWLMMLVFLTEEYAIWPDWFNDDRFILLFPLSLDVSPKRVHRGCKRSSSLAGKLQSTAIIT